MKIIVLFILLSICANCYAAEGFMVQNPHLGVKTKIVLEKDAKEFGGKIDIVEGTFAKPYDFEAVLLNARGVEVSRKKVDENGNYSFSDVKKGKWYLKFDTQKTPPKPEMKKVKIPYGSILDIPYVKEN